MKKFSKTGRRISALLLALAFVLVSCIGFVAPAHAANYTPVAGGSTTFKKFLIVKNGTTTPSVSFSYTATGGTAQAFNSTNSTMQVLKGPGTPTISTTSFSSADTLYSSAQSGDLDISRTAAQRATGGTAANGVQFDSGEKYAKKTATVSFTGITFSEPGIYRYVISESAASAGSAAAGVIHDTDTDRILDVYVTDDGTGTLVVSGYVLHTNDGTVALGDSMGSDDVAAAGDALADKTDGFTNEIKSNDLKVELNVSGNQASRDKYFEVTVELSGLDNGGSYTVSIADDSDPSTLDGNADATSGSNAATISDNSGKTNPTSITANNSGTVTQKFYIQDGQSVVIRGLPQNATYKVTENPEDYGPSYKIDNGTSVEAAGMTTSSNMSGSTHVVSLLNTRNGLVPTGIIFSMFGSILLAVVIGVGFFLNRPKAILED